MKQSHSNRVYLVDAVNEYYLMQACKKKAEELIYKNIKIKSKLGYLKEKEV